MKYNIDSTTEHIQSTSGIALAAKNAEKTGFFFDDNKANQLFNIVKYCEQSTDCLFRGGAALRKSNFSAMTHFSNKPSIWPEITTLLFPEIEVETFWTSPYKHRVIRKRLRKVIDDLIRAGCKIVHL